jgi:hypothetical protein
MKKLIVFLMVLVIGVTTLATIEDVSPPVWGGTTPSANVVWQIDTEYGVPTCTAYDPSDEDPEYFFGAHGGGPTGTWDSEAGTFTLSGGDFLHALVEVPGGVGENLTIRVQIAMEGEPDFEETNLEIWASGKEDFAGEMATNAVEDPPGSGVWVQEGTFTPSTGGVQSWFGDAGNIIGILNGGPFTMTGMIIDVIRHDGDAPTSGTGRDICVGGGPENPIAIDPNVMLVYETGETEGDFTVSLKFPPEGQGAPGNPDGTPFTVNIIVDPNGFDGGGNSDITLIGGSGPHNRISFTRDAGNWNTPKVIRFKAIEDSDPEPETAGLADLQNIVVWAEPISTTEPNWSRPVAQKLVGGTVWDNDKANILFTYTLPEKHAVYADYMPDVSEPVQLFEETRVRFGTDYLRWRKIGITLQVPPLIDADPCRPTEVKLQAVVEEVEDQPGGDNLPHSDPCLPFLEIDEPNGLIFTTANYNVRQVIKIWGVDDAALQVGGEGYPSAEGDQNYQATLVVTVIDGGGDTRYGWFEEDPEDPCAPEIQVGIEQEVQINIEDNECGAFGVVNLDIGNPNAATDPNYVDDDGNPLPDCVVDIHDAIEFVTEWLDCSDPQDPACGNYL